MSKFGTTNRECLGIETGIDGKLTYNQDRVEILKFLVKQRWTDISNYQGPWVADDLKVFVKREPHKISKLKEGRLRLISAVSLVDTMVDRILFGPMWRQALRNVGKTPVMAGWTPLKGGWRWLLRKIGKDGFSVDRAAWDWTVQQWMVCAWEEIVKQLHPGAPMWWVHRVKVRFECLFANAVFNFGDGTRVMQEGVGVMKSGCLLTLALNSVGQLLIHALASFDCDLDPNDNVPLCMGDDTLQTPFPEMFDYADSLSDYSIVKEPEITTGYLEFVGFLFSEKGFVPSYWEKHLYQLCYLDPKVELSALINYQVLWAYDRVMLNVIQDMLYSTNPEEILTDEELSRVTDAS